jgi:hypothetical protein
MKPRFVLTNIAAVTAAFLFVCVTESYAIDVTLQWDRNREPDVAGYQVWYRAGSSGPPYDGTGAYEGPSPVDAGNVTQITLHNLDDDQEYYFSVTAYDVQENHSNFSNEVSTEEPAGDPVPDQQVNDPGGDSGSSGSLVVAESSDGSTSCFITAATP